MSVSHRSENLVIQTAFLGDVLLSIPLLKQLRHLCQNNKLTLFCRKGFGDFFLTYKLVDDIVEVDKSSRQSWREVSLSLKGREFSTLVCPHRSIRSALLVSGVKARVKIGYQQFLRDLVFTQRVHYPKHLPEALRQLALLEPLDSSWGQRLRTYDDSLSSTRENTADKVFPDVPEWASMEVPELASIRRLFFTQSKIETRSTLVANHVRQWQQKKVKGIAVIAPASVWKTKMWTFEGFVAVARDLQKSGYQVVIVGAPPEQDLCERLQSQVQGAVSLAGHLNLSESAELLAFADLLVCNDSGAMHLAAAATVPTVAIFGPTTLDLGYRPWQDQARVVEAKLSCRPCGKHGAQACPLGTHECMHLVTPKQVNSSIHRLLAKN